MLTEDGALLGFPDVGLEGQHAFAPDDLKQVLHELEQLLVVAPRGGLGEGAAESTLDPAEGSSRGRRNEAPERSPCNDDELVGLEEDGKRPPSHGKASS